MLGKGGNAHREELLQHPAMVFLQCNLVSLQGVHSDEVGMLLIPLAIRDALQQHQNEFQTPGRKAEVLGLGKWVLLPSFQPGVSKHPKPHSPSSASLSQSWCLSLCVHPEKREKGWMEPSGQDMEPRAGWNPQVRPGLSWAGSGAAPRILQEQFVGSHSEAELPCAFPGGRFEEEDANSCTPHTAQPTGTSPAHAASIWHSPAPHMPGHSQSSS